MTATTTTASGRFATRTGILGTHEIAYPIPTILRKQTNVDFRMADVQQVDIDARPVLTDRGAFPYGYLVLAGGRATNYFGNDDLADHSFGLKDIDDADRLRSHILTTLEATADTGDPPPRGALLTFVVAGGGATRVEPAGQLALLAHRTHAAALVRLPRSPRGSSARGVTPQASSSNALW